MRATATKGAGGFECTFTALRAVQAGREFYVAMCPLRLLRTIFRFDEEELPAELRAQRTLNRARVPEIARYMLANPTSYVFSAISATIDGEVGFVSLGPTLDAYDVGRLTVPMTARFLINDGQHRRAAIDEALRERPDLADEAISVVFFVDAGLRRSQQMFADLNRHAIRPTQSIGILYNHRDPLSKLACELAHTVPTFKGLTEVEKTTISNRSHKLFTLSSIYLATRRLLRKGARAEPTPEDRRRAVEYWTELGKHMSDWQAVADGRIQPADLRRDFVHAHGVALQALGVAGADLLEAQPTAWKPRLKSLRRLDWSRANAKVWEGRAMVNGRVSKAESNIQLTANVIKVSLGLPAHRVEGSHVEANA